jgi:hypothetical protein
MVLQEHGISDADHTEALKLVDWTEDEYDDGEKVPPTMSDPTQRADDPRRNRASSCCLRRRRSWPRARLLSVWVSS